MQIYNNNYRFFTSYHYLTVAIYSLDQFLDQTEKKLIIVKYQIKRPIGRVTKREVNFRWKGTLT